jgi:L-ascorbate metabolism protein UlaG (beta-lactamase superfamily)
MGLSITYLGHSGFLLSDGEYSLCVDPFLTGNDYAKHKPEDIRCTHLALTHGHPDHVGDSLDIIRNNDALLIAANEICHYFGEQGVEKMEPGNPGGKIDLPFGWITFTQAFHSSSYQGRYMGLPCGLVISIGGAVFYHLGDTGIFSDLKLLGEIYRPDIAAVPVGDRFTMGPELGSRAAELVGPKVAIPIHYKTFGLLRQDASGFKPKGVEVKEMAPGDNWSYAP